MRDERREERTFFSTYISLLGMTPVLGSTFGAFSAREAEFLQSRNWVELLIVGVKLRPSTSFLLLNQVSNRPSLGLTNLGSEALFNLLLFHLHTDLLVHTQDKRGLISCKPEIKRTRPGHSIKQKYEKV